MCHSTHLALSGLVGGDFSSHDKVLVAHLVASLRRDQITLAFTQRPRCKRQHESCQRWIGPHELWLLFAFAFEANLEFGGLCQR